MMAFESRVCLWKYSKSGGHRSKNGNLQAGHWFFWMYNELYFVFSESTFKIFLLCHIIKIFFLRNLVSKCIFVVHIQYVAGKPMPGIGSWRNKHRDQAKQIFNWYSNIANTSKMKVKRRQTRWWQWHHHCSYEGNLIWLIFVGEWRESATVMSFICIPHLNYWCH